MSYKYLYSKYNIIHVYMALSREEREKKAQIVADNPNWPMSDISVTDRSRIAARAEQIRRTSRPSVQRTFVAQSGGTKKTKKRVHKKKRKPKKSRKSNKSKKSKKKSKTKRLKK